MSDDNKTKTENGATAFKSTNCARLDLYYGLTRNSQASTLIPLLEKAWREEPRHVIQILLHARDCRHGKGEKQIVYLCLTWLRQNHAATYFLNLRNFLNVGYYKDLLKLWYFARQSGVRGPSRELEMLAHDLRQDCISIVCQSSPDTMSKHECLSRLAPPSVAVKEPSSVKEKGLTLAAKWAPNEHSYFDSVECGRMAEHLAKLLFPGLELPHSKRLYRQLLVLIRKRLRVTECIISAGGWSRLNFSTIPSKAHFLLRDALKKHEPERYAAYLKDVKEGKKEIKTAGIHVHELISCYTIFEVDGKFIPAAKVNDTVEVQWKSLAQKVARDIKHSRVFDTALAMVDVSMSMRNNSAANGCVKPIHVSIGLGLLISELAQAPFHNTCISFQEKAEWLHIKGDTLLAKVNEMMAFKWDLSTNVMSAFELILEEAQKNDGKVPSTLFVLSDMEFDEAADTKKYGTLLSIYQTARAKFEAAGFQLPNTVFWNLAASYTNHCPVDDPNLPGVSILSGFSQEMLMTFLQTGNVTPMGSLMHTISKYQAAVVALEDSSA